MCHLIRFDFFTDQTYGVYSVSQEGLALQIIKVLLYFSKEGINFSGEMVILFTMSFIIFRTQRNENSLRLETQLFDLNINEINLNTLKDNGFDIADTFKIIKQKIKNKEFADFLRYFIEDKKILNSISYMMLVLCLVFMFVITVIYDPNIIFIVVFLTFFGFVFVRNFVFFSSLEQFNLLDLISVKIKFFRGMYLKFQTNKNKNLIEHANRLSHRFSSISKKKTKFFQNKNLMISPVIENIQEKLSKFDIKHKFRMYHLAKFLIFFLIFFLRLDDIYQKSVFLIEDNTFGLIKVILGINSKFKVEEVSLRTHLVVVTLLFFCINLAKYLNNLSIYHVDPVNDIFNIKVSDEDYEQIQSYLKNSHKKEIDRQKTLIVAQYKINEFKIIKQVLFYQFEREPKDQNDGGELSPIKSSPQVDINSNTDEGQVTDKASEETPIMSLKRHPNRSFERSTLVPSYNLDSERNKLLFYYYNYKKLLAIKLFLNTGSSLSEFFIYVILMICFILTNSVLFIVYIIALIYYSATRTFYALNHVRFAMAGIIVMKLIINMLNSKKSFQSSNSMTILEFIESYFKISIYNTKLSTILQIDEKSASKSIYLDFLEVLIAIVSISCINRGLSLSNTVLEQKILTGYFKFIKLKNGFYTFNLKKMKDLKFVILNFLLKLKYGIIEILVIGILIINIVISRTLFSILGLFSVLIIEIIFGFFTSEVIAARIITYKIAMIVILVLSLIQAFLLFVKKLIAIGLVTWDNDFVNGFAVSSLQDFIYEFVISLIFLKVIAKKKFITKSKIWYDKNNLSSLLKMICKKYSNNERSMFKFLKDYQVKEQLEREIKSTINFVDKWRTFTAGRNLDEEYNSGKAQKREIIQYLSSSKINEHKKLTLSEKYFNFLNSVNDSLVDEFLKYDTLELFDMLLERNRLIYNTEFNLNIKQYFRGDLSFIKDNIVLLKERYKKIYDQINIKGSVDFFAKTDFKIAILNNKFYHIFVAETNQKNYNLLLNSLNTSKILNLNARESKLAFQKYYMKQYPKQNIEKIKHSKLNNLIDNGGRNSLKTSLYEKKQNVLTTITFQDYHDIRFKYLKNKMSFKNTNLFFKTLQLLLMVIVSVFETITYLFFFLNLFLNGGILNFLIVIYIIIMIIPEVYKLKRNFVFLLIMQLVQSFKTIVDIFYAIPENFQFYYSLIFGGSVVDLNLYLIILCYLCIKFLKLKGDHLFYKMINISETMPQCYIRMRINDMFNYLISNSKIDQNFIKVTTTQQSSKKEESVKRKELKVLYEDLSHKVRSIFFHSKSTDDTHHNNVMDVSEELENIRTSKSIEKIPKIHLTRYMIRLFSPFNFKSGVRYGTLMKMVLLINLFIHLFIGHVIVGDDISLLAQISSSIISYKQLILIGSLMVLIIIEFYIDNNRSFSWYYFYNFEQTKRLPFDDTCLDHQIREMCDKSIDMNTFSSLTRPQDA